MPNDMTASLKEMQRIAKNVTKSMDFEMRFFFIFLLMASVNIGFNYFQPEALKATTTSVLISVFFAFLASCPLLMSLHIRKEKKNINFLLSLLMDSFAESIRSRTIKLMMALSMCFYLL